MMLVYKKMGKKQTAQYIKKIEKWFADNPRRQICHIDYSGVYCKIRRGQILKDIQEIGTVGEAKKAPPSISISKKRKS